MTDFQGEKFKGFLELNGISVASASEKLQVSRQTVYQYFKSKNLSREVVNNILTVFDVRLEDIWDVSEVSIQHSAPRLEAIPTRLADPEGFEATAEKTYELADGSLVMQVPIIPQRAYAGYLRGYADPEFYEDLMTIPLHVDLRHKGTYMAFEVSGDSMVNISSHDLARRTVWPGTIAIGRELSKHQWQYKLHTHNYDRWIFVHRTEGILIKEVTKHDVEGGVVTIHSLNPEYQDQDISLEDVDQIFNVVQVIDKN